MIPLNKTMKWPSFSTLPKEFFEDYQSRGKVNIRYYLMSLIEWSHTFQSPKAQVKKSIGLAGDVSAETLRIITQFNLFESTFSDQVMDSLKQFEEQMNLETKEWKIPEEEIKQ